MGDELETLQAQPEEAGLRQPSVVVCGTFHRALDGLAKSVEELRMAGCDVLSPRDLEFVGERDGFVFAAHEVDRTPGEIERHHLEAISRADFVWLHAPGGYVGSSGSMEVGLAHALGVRVYASETPSDVTVKEFVEVVDSPAHAAIRTGRRPTPTGGLAALQRYYFQVASERGYASESVQDCLLLLTEELGELARAIRKKLGLARPGRSDSAEDPALELADIQLYVVHLANVMNVDLAAAVGSKEHINAERMTAATDVA